MSWLQLHILTIASLTSVACALPGSLLVARGNALMSDAISHAVLFGIAITFLITKTLDSWWLLFGAALTGLLCVIVVEKIIGTNKLKKDAALGITFPLFFSLGVIIISCFARDVHLDIDMVLLGEIAFAPLNKLLLFGYDWGPWAYWTLIPIITCMLTIMVAAYRTIQLSIMDQHLAHLFGLSPTAFHYCLVACTSITAVAAFNIIGSLAVIALMTIPAATAYLYAKHFHEHIVLSVGFGLACACSGYALAVLLNSSIAGCMAVAAGILFCIALLISAKHNK